VTSLAPLQFEFETELPLWPFGRISLTRQAVALMMLIEKGQKMPGDLNDPGMTFKDLAKQWPQGVRSLKTLLNRYGYDDAYGHEEGFPIWLEFVPDDSDYDLRLYYKAVGLTPTGVRFLQSTEAVAKPKKVKSAMPGGTVKAATYTVAQAEAEKATIDARDDLTRTSKAAFKAHITRRTL